MPLSVGISILICSVGREASRLTALTDRAIDGRTNGAGFGNVDASGEVLEFGLDIHGPGVEVDGAWSD